MDGVAASELCSSVVVDCALCVEFVVVEEVDVQAGEAQLEEVMVVGDE